jgi:hypothetical protein
MNTIDNLLLEDEIRVHEANLTKLMLGFKEALTEGVTDLPVGDLGSMFDEAVKRLEAARRGLGLVNKLPPGDERKANRSRIMGNLNRIRALVDRITKEADAGSFALNQQRAVQNAGNSLGMRQAAPQAAAPHQVIPPRR